MEPYSNVVTPVSEHNLIFYDLIHESVPVIVNDITGTDAVLYISLTSSFQPLNIDVTEVIVLYVNVE